MDEKVKYWIELSDYDYDTALAMLQSKRYLYVGFMCHQTIEKILKAYFNSHHNEPAPYTHSLSYLAKKANIYNSLSNDFKNFIDILEPLNIEARYPSDKARLLLSLTKDRCDSILLGTKNLQSWIKERLLES
jgi:HEPN domain-containing protein